jgi:transposase InsO family protein
VAEWPVEQKRQVVKQLVKELGIGVVAACAMVGLERSTYYRVKRMRDEAPLEQILLKLAGKHPWFGYRRLTQEVRKIRRYRQVGEKRIRRIMSKLGLLIKRKKKPRRTTNSQHEHPRYPNLIMDMTIDHPEQVWVGDIAGVLLGDGSEVFLATLMDVYTRSIRGWELMRELTHQLTLGALKRALKKGCPEIHHTDQGVQYATPKYTKPLTRRGVRISMADVGQAWQNGFAERWIRTLREEEISLTEYKDFADAYRQIGKFIQDVYNRKRMHSSLDYLTPSEYEKKWREQQAEKVL